MSGLGVPVMNQFGLRPAVVEGTDRIAPLTVNRDLDKLGLLNGVTTFNFHLHLPHYALTTEDTKSIHVLSTQPIDMTRPHPFTAAGNREFNSLVWMPPRGIAAAISSSPTRRSSRRCSEARTAWNDSGATSPRCDSSCSHRLHLFNQLNPMTERDREQHGGVTGGRPEAGGSQRPCVLTINGGSSSLKFAVFAASESLDRVLTGRVERVGQGQSRLVVSAADGGRREDRAVAAPDQAAAAGLVIEEIERGLGLGTIAAVGHRIVHGGDRFVEPALITAEMIDQLRRIAPFDPEHLPGEIALIEAIGSAIPGIPQVACFDTAFHRDDAKARTDRPDPAAVLGAGRQALRFPRAVV